MSAGRTLTADFAELTDTPALAAGVPGSRLFDPAVSRLKGPHFEWSVISVARVRSTVPAQVGAEFELAPGTTPVSGSELLLVDLGRPEQVRDIAYDPALKLYFEVAAGPARRRVPMPALARPFSAGTLAVSVPAGSRPVLQVTDAGRRQSLDLTTGRRGGDAVAGYYPQRVDGWRAPAGSDVEVRLSGPGLDRPDQPAWLRLEEVDAVLRPWDSESGWAKPGRAWLGLDIVIAYGRDAARPQPPPEIVSVPESCFAATGPDGTRYALFGDPVTVGGEVPEGTEAGLGYGSLAADVPRSLRELTVTVRFCGSIATAAGPIRHRFTRDPTWTVRLTLA